MRKKRRRILRIRQIKNGTRTEREREKRILYRSSKYTSTYSGDISSDILWLQQISFLLLLLWLFNIIRVCMSDMHHISRRGTFACWHIQRISIGLSVFFSRNIRSSSTDAKEKREREKKCQMVLNSNLFMRRRRHISSILHSKNNNLLANSSTDIFQQLHNISIEQKAFMSHQHQVTTKRLTLGQIWLQQMY